MPVIPPARSWLTPGRGLLLVLFLLVVGMGIVWGNQSSSATTGASKTPPNPRWQELDRGGFPATGKDPEPSVKIARSLAQSRKVARSWGLNLKDQTLREVDFSRYSLLVVDAGTYSDTGHRVKVKALVIEEQRATLQIMVERPKGMAGASMTRPWAMILVPRAPFAPVKHVRLKVRS